MSKAEKPKEDAKASPPIVILSVSGEVASMIFKPIGIKVIIYDYDVDGTDHTDKAPDGERCVVSRWLTEN